MGGTSLCFMTIHPTTRTVIRTITGTAMATWHHGIGIGLVAPATVDASDCYVVKKVVETPFGLRVRRITVCN